MGIKLNIKNTRYDMLVAIKDTGKKDHNGASIWLCKCDCGNTINARIGHLRFGTTGSCGCRSSLVGVRAKTHGFSESRLYGVWSGMKSRCYSPSNPNYDSYGGRGIRMHKPWVSNFAAFVDYVIALPGAPSRDFLLSEARGVRGRLTIDRINNDKGYKPGNIRWATQKQQINNRRNSIKLGSYSSIKEACEDLKLSAVTLRCWLQEGLTLKQIRARAQRKLERFGQYDLGPHTTLAEACAFVKTSEASYRRWGKAGWSYTKILNHCNRNAEEE